MKPDMELALPARAENIAIVRHALGGLGEVFSISEEKLSDIRLAVTEACSNVVMHAYPDSAPDAPSSVPDTPASVPDAPSQAPETGPSPQAPARRLGWGMMEVSATMIGDELAVAVRDWGTGIKPRPDSPGLGLGLSLIAALSETVQLGHDTAEHTEVRMTFVLSPDEQGSRDGVPAQMIAPVPPDGAPLAGGGQT